MGEVRGRMLSRYARPGDFDTLDFNYLSGQKLRAKVLLQRKTDVTKEKGS